MRSPRREGQDLAIAATCFAALFVVVIAGGIASALGTSNVTLLKPQPFQKWTDKALTPIPPQVVVSLSSCPSWDGWMCVSTKDSVMYFPERFVDRKRIRLSYFHELGHVFQLAYNDEVQAQWAAFDRGCEGTYSYGCAERFGNAYRNCAVDDRYSGERDPLSNDHYVPSKRKHDKGCALIAGIGA